MLLSAVRRGPALGSSSRDTPAPTTLLGRCCQVLKNICNNKLQMARDAMSYTPGLRRGWERRPVSHSNEGAAEPQAQMQAEEGTRRRGMRGVP